MAKSSKELSCAAKGHLDNFMQLLTNSGYDEKFRAEILNLGLKGFDKIVKLIGMDSDQHFDPRARTRLLAVLPKGGRRTTLAYVSVTLSQGLQILASLSPKSLYAK